MVSRRASSSVEGAEIGLPGTAERVDDLLEREHVRDVVGLEAHARRQP